MGKARGRAGAARRTIGAACTALLLGVSAAGAVDCGGGSSPEGLDDACALNSDCDSPLICVFSRCHSECSVDRDCTTPGARCVSITTTGQVGKVCQLPSEETCSSGASCESGQICGTDGQCRAECTPTAPTATGCGSNEYCVTTGTTSACYTPEDTADDPTLTAAGVISADGAILSDAAVAVLSSSSSGGGDASGDSTVSSSGIGDGGGDSTVGSSSGSSSGGGSSSSSSGSGPTDFCSAMSSNACGGNGACVLDDAGGYACSCYGGYGPPADGGPTTCVLVDSCVANNTCNPAYPCLDTISPGQACLGQFAAWHVTDALAGPDAGATEPPHYANNGDGTITDVVTTLMWQLDVPQLNTGCAVLPADAGPDATPGTTCTVQDSMNYCATLKLGGPGDGYTDWRLPSLIEMESLLDYSVEETPLLSAPFLATAVDGQYWTSSVFWSNTAASWYVQFQSANSVTWGSNSSNADSVRCVRGTGIFPTTTPATHYTIVPGAIDAGFEDSSVTSDTVVDNYTGLTWERNVGPQLDISGCFAYCAALGDGFRMPTLKELMTLVDPTKYDPAIDGTTFPNTPAGDFWTSTEAQPATGYYYYMEFDYGQVVNDSSDSSSALYVRCVH